MRVLLKLILVLFCVQRGEGHSLPSLIDHKQETASSSHNGDESAEAFALGASELEAFALGAFELEGSGLGASELEASGLGASELGASGLGASGLGASELGASGLLASEPSPAPLVPARSRRSALASPCGLRSVLLQVRHLGLGYDSDETVLFKYCSGTCPNARNNHDLTLSNLLQSGVLPGDVREHHHEPCCRPTLHEDIAFLDNSHRWHKVEKLSAAGCSCVG
ncbi:Persephin [Dissostichus eleginoides]|uniref:Persephin n=1 Tax=Dissostichus eleginoides TaxID=100907 RepID=A0AAD9BKV5_DISEL|nr:Persephin [Dissostichus eleginoides]